MEHAKTSFLVEALEELNEQALVFEKYDLELLELAEFVSVFKKRLFLGEDFKLTIDAINKKDSIESVSINSKPQYLVRQAGKTELVFDLGHGASILLKYRPLPNVFTHLLK